MSGRRSIAARAPRDRVGALALAVIGIYAYGVVGYMLFGFSVIDAAYMTGLALTTAGFNPVAELTQAEKAFTISIAVFGVTVFLLILAMVTSAITEGRIGGGARRKRMERDISKLQDHFVVCAYGRVGRSVCREFEAEGVPFVVIDSREDLEDQMRSDGIVYIIGDPTSERVLRLAGIARARGLVCAVDDDAQNVYITLAARAIKPDLFTVARASAPESPEHLYRAGANRVISPYVSSGRHMALLGLRPRVVDYLDVEGEADDRIVRLEEVAIEAASPFVGRPLSELSGDSIAVLVRRAGGEFIANPLPSMTLDVGDAIVLAGERTARRTEH